MSDDPREPPTDTSTDLHRLPRARFGARSAPSGRRGRRADPGSPARAPRRGVPGGSDLLTPVVEQRPSSGSSPMGRRQRLSRDSGAPKCWATGKTMFHTEEAAAQALRHILSQPDTLDRLHKPARWVPCSACGDFHLTSKEAKPGVGARRRQGGRRPGRRRVAQRRSEATPPRPSTPQPSPPIHPSRASWTAGFSEQADQQHLTYRIDLGPAGLRPAQMFPPSDEESPWTP